MEIPALIDDGLFIFENSVVAGVSAKKQPTKLSAIKTAIFQDPTKAEEMHQAILDANPNAILILGTSDKMVDQIAERLGLPEVEEHIHIEDVVSEKKIQLAQKFRNVDGMHTIPAPTMQLKKQFSGFLLNARRAFRMTGKTSDEKTIVRPTYSFLGNYEVSARVITDIAEKIVKETPGVAQLLWVASTNTDDGIIIKAIILCARGAKVKTTARAFQGQLAEAVKYMTEFNILKVDVEVRGYK
ncbi:MAG: hypothetical protein Q4E99_03540 [Bacillota bacterium]|nr:hypothetical protein [Bacillota bacterium]